MAPHKLQNYLKTHRKRLGLSQDEIAFLLDCKSGAKVSRYENFTRAPSLETALMCEVVFQIPTRELFAGVFEDAHRKVRRRMRRLADKLNSAEPKRAADQQRNSARAALLEERSSSITI